MPFIIAFGQLVDMRLTRKIGLNCGGGFLSGQLWAKTVNQSRPLRIRKVRSKIVDYKRKVEQGSIG